MNNECRFELMEQPCIECKKPSGELGTCADLIYCPKCKQKFTELNNDNIDSAKVFIKLAEEIPYTKDYINEN